MTMSYISVCDEYRVQTVLNAECCVEQFHLSYRQQKTTRKTSCDITSLPNWQQPSTSTVVFICLEHMSPS